MTGNGEQLSERPRRHIRSFVRREGRLTAAQQRALDELWSLYGVTFSGSSNPASLFSRPAPVQMEIGCGTGDTLIALARQNPHRNFLGVEVHRPGVGHLLQSIHESGLGNIRVACQDVITVLDCLPAACLEALHVYFPDPWPKKRHHKRRLLQSAFLVRVAPLLQRHGRLYIATDWAGYADHILEAIAGQQALQNLAGPGMVAPRPVWRPVSRYEQRGLRLGHSLFDFILARNPASTV